jgi:hypothetical protein
MVKKSIVLCLVFGLILAVSPVWAGSGHVSARAAKASRAVKVTIPKHAVEITDGVFSLGHKVDNRGRIVEGRMFIHYKDSGNKEKRNDKGGWAGNKSKRRKDSCYAFMAKGARWKSTENYIVDPSNTRGINEAVVRSLLATSTRTWDDEVAFDIFGNEVGGMVDRANIGNLNGVNEFMFSDIDSPGAIAATIVWGIFSGRPSARELVEWDMVFDDVDFDWSAEASGVAGKMDFWNIAAHEIGHAAGMGHPSIGCTEETMYSYADFAETKKRDLYTGDIAGIKALYR